MKSTTTQKRRGRTLSYPFSPSMMPGAVEWYRPFSRLASRLSTAGSLRRLGGASPRVSTVGCFDEPLQCLQRHVMQGRR